MINLREQIEESINEARNYPYRVAFSGLTDADGEQIVVNITLDNARDAKFFDAYLEKEIDNTIYRASGGPNDYESY